MDSKIKDSSPKNKGIDWMVFGLSGGIVFVFVVAALVNIDAVSKLVNSSFAFSCKYFGAFWQVLLLATFVISIILAVSKYGNLRMGGLDKPEISTFRWVAMIMTALLAGGGVFWSAAEPMYHFLTTPPTFQGVEAATEQAVAPALAQSYLHWGFLAWAILATLSAVVLMYSCYHKGMELKPRALLYPVLGEKGVNSFWGVAADASSMIAVAAGTIGPIGFLALQFSFALEHLFGIPNVYGTQFAIIIGLILVYTLTAVAGIDRGIDFLARLNVYIAIFVMAVVLLIGPGGFIIDSFLTSFGLYMQDFVRISLFRADTDWLGWWTVFYWGWFLGYGPMMALFTARISRGRTIREIIMAVAIIAPVVTNIWFTVLGGAGIYYELQNKGSVSNALNDSGLPAALFAIVQQLPLASIMVPIVLVLVVLFLVTTGAGMTYTMAMASTGDGTPSKAIRVYWGVMMGAVAAVLIKIGEGGIGALQSFIVVTAVPVSLLLLPTLWAGPKVAAQLAKTQQEIQLSRSLCAKEPGAEVGENVRTENA